MSNSLSTPSEASEVRKYEGSDHVSSAFDHASDP